MKTLNTLLTEEQASKLFNSKDGAEYPNTPHNKMMMKKQVDNLMLELRGDYKELDNVERADNSELLKGTWNYKTT